ncbi:recombination regulator RecX [Bacillus sp. FJAT-45350]|uniref:recombination regulator RecX n=1 Tax=Bacillus sp. FJAT-45350 TaxID=2011014 RepID=UPI000BB820B1|nr:recombination regulator RecX [Bacillus sp. FJAT-45350]
MIKVTKITTQKRTQERFNVFIDRGRGEEYGFSVDQDVLISKGIKKGKELNEDDLKDIFYEDNIKKAYNLAILYLSYRIRTEKEIKDYLLGKEMEEEVISVIINKLHNYKYIDDLEFAMAFVRTRMNTTVKGPNIIRQELDLKGVKREYIEKALLQFTFDDQLEKVKDYLEKKGKPSSRESASAVKQKISNRLVAKGFSFQIIDEAWKLVEVTTDTNIQLDALEYQASKYERKLKGNSSWEQEMKLKQFLYRKGFSSELVERYLEEKKNNPS